MRIIAGKHRGLVLHPPKGLPVRPTSDRTKESLFNVLQNHLDLEGAAILDLCCGTGNVAFECVSRGAASALAVDLHRPCVMAAQAGFDRLGFAAGKALQRDAFKFAAECPHTFDFIFLDPPYAMPRQHELLHTLLTRSLLRPGGWLVLEHATPKAPQAAGLPPAAPFATLPGYRFQRLYGGSALSFFAAPVA